MGFFNGLDWFDITKDVAIETVNATRNDQQDWNERAAAAGVEDAQRDAAQDYSQGRLNDDIMAYQDADVSQSYAERFLYQDAQDAAAEAEKIANIALGSPIQVAASIFFTTTETALDPHDQNSFWSTGREAYEGAYAPAYRDEAVKQFDQQLESRFQPDSDIWRDGTRQEVDMSPVFPDYSYPSVTDPAPSPPPAPETSGSSGWGDTGGGASPGDSTNQGD
jgi:hypothetical protein